MTAVVQLLLWAKLSFSNCQWKMAKEKANYLLFSSSGEWSSVLIERSTGQVSSYGSAEVKKKKTVHAVEKQKCIFSAAEHSRYTEWALWGIVLIPMWESSTTDDQAELHIFVSGLGTRLLNYRFPMTELYGVFCCCLFVFNDWHEAPTPNFI